MAYCLLNHQSINNDDHEYSLTNQLALISTLPQPERTYMPSSGFVSASPSRQGWWNPIHIHPSFGL